MRAAVLRRGGLRAVRVHVGVDREHSRRLRARETYRILGPDEFVERFELAEPDKKFALYSETILKRVK